jgi:hypothetical protein
MLFAAISEHKRLVYPSISIISEEEARLRKMGIQVEMKLYGYLS